MILEKPTEIWVPVLMHPQLAQSSFIKNRRDRWLRLMGRVKDGVTMAHAEASMDALAEQITEASTPPGMITKGLPFSEQHIKFEPGGVGISILRQRFSAPLKLLMAVVGLVLLIACANVAGLLLARGLQRRKEIVIRLALGAGVGRLARQLLTESLLLAVAGGAVGLLLAPWLVALLVRTQTRLNLAQTLLGEGLDRRVLAFTTLATLLAGLVFGLAPAWQSARCDLIPALKEEGGSSAQRDRRFNFRSLLVVTQLALALVVLIGAGLCIKSLRNLLAIDPGYQTERLLIVPLDLGERKYDQARGRALQQQVRERLAALPGVEAVSYGLVVPLSGSRYMISLLVAGRQPLPDEQMAFDASIVGPGYHETMGIQIAAGRGFTAQDREGAPGVVIVNEALAQRLFPDESALGQRVSLGTGAPLLEIIGITRDGKYHDLTEAPLPHFDLPALQRGYDSYTNFVVRTEGRAADMLPSVRGALLALDASLPTEGLTTMSAQIGHALAAMRLASTLVGVFGLVALLLAGIGVAIGLTAAFILTRLIESQLYAVTATDPLTFALVALLLAGVALLACYLPARRAMKVDPMVALRCE
jgi:predicted permease